MSKAQQLVYVIKAVREGNPTPLTFEGVDYLIVPYEECEQGCFVHNGRTLQVSWKQNWHSDNQLEGCWA